MSVIPDGTWARVATAAIFDRRLSAEALRVLSVLGTYADEIGHCYPSVSTMAARLGLQRRQVQRHLRKLEELGYVQSYRRTRIEGGGYASNGYQLRFPAVTDARNAGGGAHPAAEWQPATGAPQNAIARGAASDDAPTSGDAASGDASAVENAASTAVTMRHPKAQRCVIGRHSDAASDAALTNPKGTNPKGTSPKPRACAREAGAINGQGEGRQAQRSTEPGNTSSGGTGGPAQQEGWEDLPQAERRRQVQRLFQNVKAPETEEDDLSRHHKDIVAKMENLGLSTRNAWVALCEMPEVERRRLCRLERQGQLSPEVLGDALRRALNPAAAAGVV